MSKIEWTDQTWNPIIGCSKTSPGCDNCYAEKMAGRLANLPYSEYGRVVIAQMFQDTKPLFSNKWNGTTHFIESALEKPLKRKSKKPIKYFVCSMGDLFHESVPFEWIAKVYDIIAQSRQHTFQILTKRPERMLEFFQWFGTQFKESGFDSVPTQSTNPFDYFEVLPNLWLGVSAENQNFAIDRILTLLEIPATKHFVSLEPLLGEINLLPFLPSSNPNVPLYEGNRFLDWVILGGESGPNARPMHPDWVRSIRHQCQAASVPFFFKQWGEWAPVHALNCNAPGIKGKMWCNFDPDTSVCRIDKKQAGRLLDGKEYNEFPKSY
jgi:protein gp37